MKTSCEYKSKLVRLLSIYFLMLSTQLFACQLSSVWEPFPPYQYMDEQGVLTGLDIDLLRAVAMQANCKINFQKTPWKRGLALIQKGEIDVAGGASKTKERSQYAHYSDPYRFETMSVYIRNSEYLKQPFSNLEELALSSIHLGIVIGYSYGAEFFKLRQKKAFKGRITEVLTDSQNIHKLSIGRVDAILVEQFVGKKLMAQGINSKDIKTHPLKIETGGIYFLFSKKSVSKKQVAKFNLALKHIKDSGKYHSISNHYLNSKY